MKKTMLILLTFLISNSILAQKNNAEFELYESEFEYVEINELLNYPISNLTDNKILNALKKKTNSELNTLASILLNYKYAKTLNFAIEEQIGLQMRMVEIADTFFEKNKLFFLEHSGGYLPTFIETEKIYNNKKVRILLMGGGTCMIDEINYNAKRIYRIFNERMKKNMAE